MCHQEALDIRKKPREISHPHQVAQRTAKKIIETPDVAPFEGWYRGGFDALPCAAHARLAFSRRPGAHFGCQGRCESRGPGRSGVLAGSSPQATKNIQLPFPLV